MNKWLRVAICALYLIGCFSIAPALAEPQPPAAAPAVDAKTADEKPAADTAEGDAKKDENKQVYIRVIRDDRKRPITMETAIVSYVSAGEKNKGVQVDLVGAVHVGDADYYEKLNKVFEEYDVLLYELVAPEGTRIPKGGRASGGGLLGSLQGGMKTILELEHQLEKVDYTKKNFVHADMSPTEFAKSMKDRGESFFQMFLKSMSQSAKQGQKGAISEVDLFMAMFAKDRALRLKRLMANQFANMDDALNMFNGPDGSTIVTERNKKCLTILEREIKNGHKKIGIFYGAAHLPDMDERLLKEFGMQRDKNRWVVAWNLESKKPTTKKPNEGEAVEEASDKPDAAAGTDSDSESIEVQLAPPQAPSTQATKPNDNRRRSRPNRNRSRVLRNR
jgi:hypothetical protein